MLVNRHIKNPLITIKDIKPSNQEMEVIGVFNAGVIEYNNQIVMLMRVAEKVISNNDKLGIPLYDSKTNQFEIKYFDKVDKSINFQDPRFIQTKDKLYLTSMSHIKIAYSNDGINFKIEQEPFMVASNEYETYGIEDPRITKIDNTFYITYSSISAHGVTTSLVVTKDFKKVDKKGVIFLPDNKDVVIFPEKINGKYYALNRPVSAYFQKPEIWISESDDLLSFNNHKMLATLIENNFDSTRIGASCVPFLTKDGWIEIYHGADHNDRYCVGALLLDKNDPTKILKRTEKAIIEPTMDYETKGFMPNVIFPCGHILKDDIIHLYYGSCDESISYLTFKLKDLMDELEKD